MRARRTLAFALAALGGLALAAPAAIASGGPSTPFIVVFRDSAISQSGATGAHSSVDPNRVGQLVSALARSAAITPDNVYSSVMGGFAARLNASQLAAVKADPSVESVTPDASVTLQQDEGGPSAQETLVSVSSPKVPAGIRRIGATQNGIAAINGDGGKVNADVAVIDTGIQRDHPDLNVVGGYNCSSSNRGAWDDGNGHGTHVAGTIGALDNGTGVVGVAPGVRLWAIKVLDNTGNGLTSWIICGIDWITSQRISGGARPLIDVANMSLRSFMPAGGDDHNCGRTITDNLHRAICRSVAAGTVYVAAAGNDRNDASNYRPGAYDEVITVSAMTDYDGKPGGLGTRPADCPAGYPDDSWAGFSNFGNDVDLTAPGVCVLSTWAGSQYAYASGTSMAAPHVTGAVALYLVQYPYAKPQQVKMALQHAGHTDWKRWTDPDGHPDVMVYASGFDAPPDFDLSASAAGGYSGLNETINVPVSIDRLRGHTAPITLSVSGLPPSLTAADVTTTGSSATLQVQVGSYAASGRYTATITADDGELTHTTTVDIRVDGDPPSATFTAPTADRMQSTTSAHIAWTESDTGGSGVAGRVVWRQRATPVVPGNCTGLTYNNVGFPHTSFGSYNDPLYSGYCYRWSLTVRDGAGNHVTVPSHTVLVDTTQPTKPTASVTSSSSTVVPVSGVSLPSAYVDGSGTLWLRGGGSGTLDLAVKSNDPTSSVSSISLTPTTATTGWTFPRTISGGSATAHFSYTAKAVPLSVSLRATNGAGLSSYTTTFRTVPDGTAPSPATWAAPVAGFWYSPDGAVILRWTGGSDSGSGLAYLSYIRRQRAPVTSTGSCGSWSNDGSPRLLPNGFEETGLPSAYCFRWIERNSDHVGNLAPSVVSGTVLVDKVQPKVTIYKPLPGPTVVKTKNSQTVSWSVSDAGGSHLSSVTVQRQRATSHPAGTCDGVTWKLDGSPRTVASPLTETGLAGGSCYRWVIKATDKATNVTAAITGAVLISAATTTSSPPSAGSTAPTVSNLSVVPTLDRLTASDMVHLSATWSATAGSGTLVGYQLRLSSSGGSTWSTFTPPNGTTPQMTLQLPAGRTYLVEVRAANDLGAWSDWSAPSTFALGLAEGEGSGFQEVGTWKSAALSGASAGAVTYSTSANDIIRYVFTGRSVALVSTLGPDRGVVDVYIDGWRAATVDLYSPTLTTRQVVFIRSWASSGSHMISLQLRGTAGRPRVDVDAVVVLN